MGLYLLLKLISLVKIQLIDYFNLIYLGGKTPDPQSKARSYAEIMGEVNVRNAKVRFISKIIFGKF